MSKKPIFFETPRALRDWLKRHHAKADELWVGFFKKGTGKPSITWPESVDEALCFGWIDGIRKSIDATSYTIRFTRRKPGSTWSSINIKRVQSLIKEGRMQPAGLKAYQKRKENKSGIYSYEQRPMDLPEPYLRLLKRNKAAWNFFQTQPAYYRKTVTWWIISAKKEDTRIRRLEKLTTCSIKGVWIPEFIRRKASGN